MILKTRHHKVFFLKYHYIRLFYKNTNLTDVLLLCRMSTSPVIFTHTHTFTSPVHSQKYASDYVSCLGTHITRFERHLCRYCSGDERSDVLLQCHGRMPPHYSRLHC